MASMAEKNASNITKTSSTFKEHNIQCNNSYFLFSKKNKIRIFFKWICLDNEKTFDKIILTLIILGSIKLGFDSYLR